jgi:gliding motility-associated lipoprotein GldH
MCSFFASCANLDVFEKTVSIPGQTWYYNNKPSFTFSITDTSAAYNVFIVLRHTDAYQYNNIWLNVISKAPGESARSQNIDVSLGSDAKGWYGNGMDDIFEFRKNITRGPIPFKKAGSYTFTISQIMRENPLRHTLNVGIRVEKVRL